MNKDNQKPLIYQEIIDRAYLEELKNKSDPVFYQKMKKQNRNIIHKTLSIKRNIKKEIRNVRIQKQLAKELEEEEERLRVLLEEQKQREQEELELEQNGDDQSESDNDDSSIQLLAKQANERVEVEAAKQPERQRNCTSPLDSLMASLNDCEGTTALQINKNLNFRYYHEKRKKEQEKEIEDIINKLKVEKSSSIQKQKSNRPNIPRCYFKVFKPSTMLKGQYKQYREKEVFQ